MAVAGNTSATVSSISPGSVLLSCASPCAAVHEPRTCLPVPGCWPPPCCGLRQPRRHPTRPLAASHRAPQSCTGSWTSPAHQRTTQRTYISYSATELSWQRSARKNAQHRQQRQLMSIRAAAGKKAGFQTKHVTCTVQCIPVRS
jgi:hypothetical protein